MTELRLLGPRGRRRNFFCFLRKKKTLSLIKAPAPLSGSPAHSANLRFTPPALAARSCFRAACEAWEAGSCSCVVSDAANERIDRRAVVVFGTLKGDKDDAEATSAGLEEAALEVATPPRAAMRVAMVTSEEDTRKRGSGSAFAGRVWGIELFFSKRASRIYEFEETSIFFLPF